MPWKQVYEPAPKDMSLKVWRENELPDGTIIETEDLFRNFRAANLWLDDQLQHWYECRHCGGFIEGHYNQYEVNTLNSYRLSGRKGIEYYCRRCGEQIAFNGWMS